MVKLVGGVAAWMAVDVVRCGDGEEGDGVDDDVDGVMVVTMVLSFVEMEMVGPTRGGGGGVEMAGIWSENMKRRQNILKCV
nr:hypothetical protein [Tanacetum cinerariifolium]